MITLGPEHFLEMERRRKLKKDTRGEIYAVWFIIIIFIFGACHLFFNWEKLI